jgi:formate transporter
MTKIKSIAVSKGTANGWIILLQGIACNWIVCATIFCVYAVKDGIAKLFCVWFFIMGFVVVGFEHCVVNGFYLPLGLMFGAVGITWWHFLYSLTISTIGVKKKILIFFLIFFFLIFFFF